METPRILMLVLANDDGGLYSGLQEITKLYMASNPQIDCYFFKGREAQDGEYVLEEHSLYIKTYEGYGNDALFKKSMAAFKYFEPVIDTYDYIFRTNLSTFVRFDMLLNFCQALPKTGVYCGHALNDYGINFVSGTGIIMSTDIVKRLLKEPPTFFIQDDLTFGKTMGEWGVSIIHKPAIGIQPDNVHAPDVTSLPKLQGILDNPGDAYQIRIRTGDAGRLERDLQIHKALYSRFYKSPHVAVLYWGMTRSTRHVYKSHENNLFAPLDASGISYDTYMHTWRTEINRVWNKDLPIPCDYDEYRLLKPTAYRIDDQSAFLSSIDMNQYFYRKVWESKGDCKTGEWWPELIQNHLCALESMKRVTQMMLDSGKQYDYIIYCRPDVDIYTPFPVGDLDRLTGNDIAVPTYDSNEGYNDKFAVMRYEHCKPYAFRIDNAAEYRRHNGRIVSEKYTKFIVDAQYRIKPIEFRFALCRPDGKRG